MEGNDGVSKETTTKPDAVVGHKKKRRGTIVIALLLGYSFLVLAIILSLLLGNKPAEVKPVGQPSEAIGQFLDKCKAGKVEEAFQEYVLRSITLPDILQGDFEYQIIGTQAVEPLPGTQPGDCYVYVRLVLANGEAYGVTFMWSQVGNEIIGILPNKEQPPPGQGSIRIKSSLFPPSKSCQALPI